MVRIHNTLQVSLSAVAESEAKIFEKMESNSTNKLKSLLVR